MTSFAPGTNAPDASATVPSTRAFWICAETEIAKRPAMPAMARTRFMDVNPSTNKKLETPQHTTADCDESSDCYDPQRNLADVSSEMKDIQSFFLKDKAEKQR